MLRLTREREKRGWSKARLSYEAHIHPSDIGKLEAGKIFLYPSFQKKLEQVFSLSAEELFKKVEAE